MFNKLFEHTNKPDAPKAKLQYAGDCVTILDDGSFDSFAADATQLAQLVENGKQISLPAFVELTTIDPTMVEEEFLGNEDRYTFWYNEEKNVAWYNDGKKDIEYFYSLYEAKFSDIRRKQKSVTKLFPAFPSRVDKVKAMGGVLLGKTGTESWHFKIHSGTKKNVEYDAVLHFKDILPTLNQLIHDMRLWVTDRSKVNMSLLAKQFLENVEIEISCSCPAQSFWGGNYILSKSKYNAKYGDKETRSPQKRNPSQYGATCKHLAALFITLPFQSSTAAKWLGEFYGADIKDIEKDVQKEYGWVKKSAEELKAKVEPKKEEPKQEVKPIEQKPETVVNPEIKPEEVKPEENK